MCKTRTLEFVTNPRRIGHEKSCCFCLRHEYVIKTKKNDKINNYYYIILLLCVYFVAMRSAIVDNCREK